MPIPTELLEKCWPVLEDATLDDDDRADKLQDIVRDERPSFTTEEVEQTVLDALWKHRAMTSEKVNLSHIPQTRLSRLAPGVKTATLPRQPFVLSSTPKQTPDLSRPMSRKGSGLFPPNNNGSRPGTASHTPATGSPYLRIATPVAGPIPNSPRLSEFASLPRDLDGSYSWRRPLALERHRSADPPSFDEQDDGYKDLTKDGDLRNHSADWLLVSDDEDDIFSNFSSSGNGRGSEGRGMSNLAIFPSPDEDVTRNKWSQQYLPAQEISALSPHDQVRYCFGLQDDHQGGLSNKELESLLEEHSWDLVATLDTLVKRLNSQQQNQKEDKKTVIVGKSMALNSGRPFTPSDKQRPQTPASTAIGTTVCRYWLSSGQCARADCKYSHDPSTVLCKYWLTSECVAPNGCIFSHNPVMSLMMSSSRSVANYSTTTAVSGLLENAQDYAFDGGYDAAFPALGIENAAESSRVNSPSSEANVQTPGLIQQRFGTPTHGQSSKKKLNPLANFTPSRPTSQNTSRAGTPGPAHSTPSSIQDKDGFPALSGGSKGSRHHHHHGKRAHHNHDHHENSDKKAGPIKILMRGSEDVGESTRSPPQSDDANKKKTRRGPRKSKRNMVLTLPISSANDSLDDS